jgi:hypothetical protein
MSIRKFLDLSTNHLPEHLGTKDLAAVEGILASPWSEYGWFVWVPDEPTDSSLGDETPVPEEILHVQRYARSLGCDFILFDSEGPHDPTLPSWDW